MQTNLGYHEQGERARLIVVCLTLWRKCQVGVNIHVVLGKREGEINKLTALPGNGSVFSKASDFSLELGIPVPDRLVRVVLEMQQDFIESLRADSVLQEEGLC